MKKSLELGRSALEFIVAAVFIIGSLGLIGQPPLTGEGFVVLVLGGQAALYFYIFWFAALGITLILSKVFHWRKIHLRTLMFMYLTTIYTFFLGGLLTGWWGLHLIDDVVIGVLVAGLWLWWKMKTEYIEVSEIESISSHHLSP